MTHVKAWNLGRYAAVARTSRGFTLLEVLTVVGIIGVLAGMAVVISQRAILMAKGEGATTQMKGFLSKHREMAIARRRNIEIRFVEPDLVRAFEMPIPGVELEEGEVPYSDEIQFEGGLRYLTFNEVPDTPDAFGMTSAITLGGDTPVMFTSEGSFTDVNGDPVNASIFMGVRQQPLTANAITILGTTASVHHWRWNGGNWTD